MEAADALFETLSYAPVVRMLKFEPTSYNVFI
jgi:hypothetical protein